MFRNVTRTYFPAIVMLLWMIEVDLNGQQKSGEIQPLKESSLASFDQGNYSAALSGFRTLLEIEGNDPVNVYYVGRCLVELNRDMDEAIELLYDASKRNGPKDALFYLGKAYMRNYNFQDAITYFERFETNASRQERKEYDVKHLIETCRSATEITSEYNPFEVMNVTWMDLSDSLQYSQVKMKGGDLTKKPESYFQSDEDHSWLTSLMFKQKDAVRGDYRYYSGYEKNGKDGAQIFRVRKGPGKYWGDPEMVSSLNSPGNEILPYFDPIEKDIYFASDGRFRVGGYDLYKSHYDVEHDQWSDPINLGFPVNSVMDEYLLLPGSDLGMVLFFTNRQGTDSTVTIYRLHLIEPKKKTAMKDPQKLLEIAQLGKAADEFLAGLALNETAGPAAKRKETPGVDPMVTRVSDRPVNSPTTAYQQTLSAALSHQVVSDSLKDLATSARMRVRESDDPNDRWVWQKQIIVWEKKAGDEEAMADQLYAKMELERSDNTLRYAVNPPETIEVDRVIDDLTVYRFKEQNSGQVTTAVNKFDILSSSPYSAANPIPMDIELPAGIFYRIQLGAYGSKVEPEVFGGISPITGEHIKERSLIKYFVGTFTKYDDASTALPRIHTLGYEDAFIVAWYNGNPVPTQKAKQLE